MKKLLAVVCLLQPSLSRSRKVPELARNAALSVVCVSVVTRRLRGGGAGEAPAGRGRLRGVRAGAGAAAGAVLLRHHAARAQPPHRALPPRWVSGALACAIAACKSELFISWGVYGSRGVAAPPHGLVYGTVRTRISARALNRLTHNAHTHTAHAPHSPAHAHTAHAHTCTGHGQGLPRVPPPRPRAALQILAL